MSSSTIAAVATTPSITAGRTRRRSPCTFATRGSFCEPDRMAVPPHGRASAVSCWPGTHDVALRRRVALHVLVAFEVEPVGLEDGEDRLGRGVGREALPEHEDVEGVQAGRLERDVRRDLAGRVHLRDARARAAGLRRRTCRPNGRLGVQHPVLLAGGVEVVAAGGGAGLDDLRPVLDERADHVADDLRAVEQVGERLDGVLDLDDVVLGGLEAGHACRSRPAAASSRPAATNGTSSSRRYSQTGGRCSRRRRRRRRAWCRARA